MNQAASTMMVVPSGLCNAHAKRFLARIMTPFDDGLAANGGACESAARRNGSLATLGLGARPAGSSELSGRHSPE